MQPQDALWFGLVLTVAGLGYLAVSVNGLSAGVAAAITLSYLLAYTPMKRVSSLCVPVGAIPGALPPVIGWVAARGDLSVDAWVLFAIMFLWQIPHTLAIACLYREDFAKAGIQFLPVIEPDWREHQPADHRALLGVARREPVADADRTGRRGFILSWLFFSDSGFSPAASVWSWRRRAAARAGCCSRR